MSRFVTAKTLTNSHFSNMFILVVIYVNDVSYKAGIVEIYIHLLKLIKLTEDSVDSFIGLQQDYQMA